MGCCCSKEDKNQQLDMDNLGALDLKKESAADEKTGKIVLEETPLDKEFKEKSSKIKSHNDQTNVLFSFSYIDYL